MFLFGLTVLCGSVLRRIESGWQRVVGLRISETGVSAKRATMNSRRLQQRSKVRRQKKEKDGLARGLYYFGVVMIGN